MRVRGDGPKHPWFNRQRQFAAKFGAVVACALFIPGLIAPGKWGDLLQGCAALVALVTLAYLPMAGGYDDEDR